eukprot:UC1_evm2s1801
MPLLRKPFLSVSAGGGGGRRGIVVGILILLSLSCIIMLLPVGVAKAHEVMDGCNVKDADGSIIFDLAPLYRDEGEANWEAVDARPEHQDLVYYINVCGHVNDAEASDTGAHGCVASDHVDETAAVCQARRHPGDAADDGKLPLGLGVAEKFTLSLINAADYEAGVRLVYTGGAKNTASCHGKYARRTEIQFTCGTALGVPTFLEETPECVYIFEWKTSLVCRNHAPADKLVKCDVEGGDHVFNLASLARTDANWEAVDTREGSKFSYLLNVCRPLVTSDTKAEKCNGKDESAGCQLTGTGSTFDLGTPQPPRYDAAGGLLIEYKGGTKCHAGTANESPRSAIIYLSCPTDRSAGLGHPVFREETGTCQYVFDWETSAACPVGHVNEGKDCKVSDDMGNVYDLDALRHVEWDVKDKWQATVASFSVCDHLEAGCGGEAMSGACFHGANNKHESLGTFSNELQWANDNLFMEYRSKTTCPNDPEDTKNVLINFVCDESAVPPPWGQGEGGEVRQQATLVRATPDCFYEVTVATSLACAPKRLDCLVVGGGNTYDLSSLSTGAHAWTVMDAREDDTYRYSINVCQGVPRPADVPACAGVGTDESTGGWQLKPTDKSLCKSLGKVQPPMLMNGKLMAKYSMGTKCHSGSDSETTRSMTINFECGEGKGAGEPTFIDELDGCEYVFEWVTAAACPLKIETGSGCAVEDKATGFMYDFSSLKDKEYEVGKHHIALCGHAKSCPPGSAACLGGTDVGHWADKPVLNDGIVTLEYTSGGTCKGSRGKVRTLIKMRCAPGLSGEDGPRMVFSDECTHEFEWATKLACQPRHEAIDCVTTDPATGHVFDLTRLVNPESNYETSAGTFLYVVNICRPIVPIKGSTCHLDASACQIEASTDHTDKHLGLPAAPQWDAEKKQVYMELQHGTGNCKGENERSSRIDFICPADGVEKELHFVGESDMDCTYYFVWETVAACPVKELTSDDCSVTDAFTGVVLDLNRLKGQSYSVNAGAYSYSLGVCGETVKCGDKTSGACQTKPGESDFVPRAMGAASSTVHYEDSQLTLKFSGGDACHQKSFKRSTVISFVCDREAGLGHPEFEEELASCAYVFRWRTALACTPALDCKAVDAVRGLEYDLSALANPDRNWVATDAHNSGKFQFWLNLCRPLVPQPDQARWSCGPFAAACQLASEHRYYELGYPAGPKIDNNGDLTVVFEGGQLCHGKYNRSAEVKFSCPIRNGHPATGLLGAPAYMYESDDCRSYFEWETSAACPVGGHTTPPATPNGGGDSGGNCKAVDPIWGDTYDLSSLGEASLSVEVTDKSDKYRYFVGICGQPDTGDYDGCDGAGACQTKPSDETFSVNMGQASSNLKWVDGALTLTYEGGKSCHGQYERTTSIIFSCDKTSAADEPVLRFIEETADCIYRFEVATSLACPRAHEVECVVRDTNSNKEYDISTLTKTADNWAAALPLGKGDRGEALWINVCRSLVPKKDGSADCPADAGACLQTADGDHVSLGKVAPPVVLPSGQLALKLTNGGSCPDATATGTTASATIALICDRSGRSTAPALLEVTESCEYAMEWRTAAACSLEDGSTTKAPAASAPVLPTSACVFTDKLGNKYDLTALSHHDYTGTAPNTADDGTPYSYTMRPCAHVTSCGGKSQVGACQSKGTRHWSMGKFVQAPVVEGGALRMRFRNGDTCHGKYKRSAEVTFVCDSDAGEGAPAFVAETDECIYEFEWKTSHACPVSVSAPVDCFIRNPRTGAEYDLTVLTKTGTQKPWLALDTQKEDQRGKYEFLLNVCGPLTSTLTGQALGPCAGAAGCQTWPDKTHDPMPIGHAVNEPVVRDSGDIVLRYTLPEASKQLCHGAYHRSTSITFSCKPGTRGEPVYLGESEECEYKFAWETSAACDISNRTRGSGCKVRDPVTGVAYDLTPLANRRQQVRAGKYTYALGVCRDLDDDCAGFGDGRVGACQSAGSQSYAIGTATDAPVIFDGRLRLEYTDGAVCHKGTGKEARRSAVIQFECDPKAGKGQPEFLWESDKCTYFFKWVTSFACGATPDAECLTADVHGNEYDLSPLTLTKGNWEVLDELKRDSHRYYINVCHALNPEPALSKCTTGSAACQVDASGDSSYSLGRVGGPSVMPGKGLMLHYTDGDTTLCPGGRGREVSVAFTCKTSSDGLPLGVPKFRSEPEACRYEIEWASSAACRVQASTPAGHCKVKDSVTGIELDFSSLGKAEPARVEAPDGHVYRLNPCALLPTGGVGGDSGGCKTSSNVCQETRDGRHFSLGRATGIELHGEQAVARIMSGDLCHNKYHRQALIQFKCGVTTGDNVVEFIEETDECSYTFEWTTPFACVTAGKECVVHTKSGYSYDLSSLAKSSSATTLTTKYGKLSLNVCNGVHANGCDARAGACLITRSGNVLDVGTFANTKPVFVDGKVRLDYTGGTCPEKLGGSGRPAATHITFYCSQDKKRQGPELYRATKTGTGCLFNVHWHTCAVCEGLKPCENSGISTPPPDNYDPGTASNSGDGDNQPSGDGSGGGGGNIAAAIIIPILVVLLLAAVLRNPDRRDRIWRAATSCGQAGRATYAQFKYQPVSMSLIGGAGEGAAADLEGGQELIDVSTSGGTGLLDGESSGEDDILLSM